MNQEVYLQQMYRCPYCDSKPDGFSTPTTLINHIAKRHQVQLRPRKVGQTRNIGRHEVWLKVGGEPRLCCPCCSMHFRNGSLAALLDHFQKGEHLIPPNIVRSRAIGEAPAAGETPAAADAAEVPVAVEMPVAVATGNAEEDVMPARRLPATYLVPATREQENSVWDFSGIHNAETRQRLHTLARFSIPAYARRRPDWELRMENERIENHQRREDEYYMQYPDAERFDHLDAI